MQFRSVCGWSAHCEEGVKENPIIWWRHICILFCAVTCLLMISPGGARTQRLSTGGRTAEFHSCWNSTGSASQWVLASTTPGLLASKLWQNKHNRSFLNMANHFLKTLMSMKFLCTQHESLNINTWSADNSIYGSFRTWDSNASASRRSWLTLCHLHFQQAVGYWGDSQESRFPLPNDKRTEEKDLKLNVSLTWNRTTLKSFMLKALTFFFFIYFFFFSILMKTWQP